MVSAKHTIWLTELGKTLQRLRKSKKISQDQLAHSSGLSRRTLVSLEQGSGCTMETLLSILDGLGESEEMERWLKDFSSRKISYTESTSGTRKKHFRNPARSSTSQADQQGNPWVLER